MNRQVPLEPAAQKVCETSAKPPLIFQLPPPQGRKTLDRLQDAPVFKYPAKITTMPFRTGKYGTIPLHCIQPANLAGTAHIILYIHGAGWVFGGLHTHDKLVRELAARTNSIVLFPEYSLSPEARYPTAVEQCYSVLRAIPDIGRRLGRSLNLNTLTVAGDSSGGNLAAVTAILAKHRRGPKIHKQLLYYPVTNAAFDTGSYQQFASGYYLYRAGMMWFWNQYAPLERDRLQITASPLRASVPQLQGLPDAMILNAEAEVLRDEGEAYARKLRKAGVEVTAMRFQAMIHDFVMLNALDQTNACRAAMDVSTDWINRKNSGR